MLIDLHTGRPIDRIPFQATYDLIEARLTAAELAGVMAEIDARIDAAGGDIATAGWLPGADWRGTPFWPIYAKAARRNEELAGKMFGLLVWCTVRARPEAWGSKRCEIDGEDIGSRTYFQLPDYAGPLMGSRLR